jgi:divalent metal cation (Fe/Co/Zn/Cd) transporter
MLRETVDSMIGSRVDSELSKKIKSSICEVPGVYGAYDLSLHNYGPEDMQGSVHVEVDDTLTALEIHNLSRTISTKIFEEFSIILTVGIYARNDKYQDIRSDLDNIVKEYEEIIEIHGFIVYEDMNLATFDLIVDFDSDREKIKSEVLDKIKSKHPQFDYIIIDDYDISD